MAEITWRGCYDSSWGPFLVPEAVVHPAKVAHGLAERIYCHMLERGYVKPGGQVVVTLEIREDIKKEIDGGLFQRIISPGT